MLTIRYTARPGVPKATVSPAVATWLQANSTQLFSMRHEFPSEWARFQRTQLIPGQTVNLSFELKDAHFPYRMQGSFSNAHSVHLFGRTKVQQIEAELVRGTTSVGKTTLTNGEGVIVPPPQSGTPGNFDPRGNFELRFDTNVLEDLWVVVDWSAATP